MNTKEYKVIITITAYKEINRIYDYINEDLYAKNAAKELMKKVEDEVQRLKYSPKIHTKIELEDELNRTYRRIVVKNYIILYTVDEEKLEVFVSHMYYKGRDYK